MRNKNAVAIESEEQKELRAQIEHFRERVAWQASRGRFDGTYDHQRLQELEAALVETQKVGIDQTMEVEDAS